MSGRHTFRQATPWILTMESPSWSGYMVVGIHKAQQPTPLLMGLVLRLALMLWLSRLMYVLFSQ